MFSQAQTTPTLSLWDDLAPAVGGMEVKHTTRKKRAKKTVRNFAVN